MHIKLSTEDWKGDTKISLTSLVKPQIRTDLFKPVMSHFTLKICMLLSIQLSKSKLETIIIYLRIWTSNKITTINSALKNKQTEWNVLQCWVPSYLARVVYVYSYIRYEDLRRTTINQIDKFISTCFYLLTNQTWYNIMGTQYWYAVSAYYTYVKRSM